MSEPRWTRSHMSCTDRAKIFVPFDPLAGFREALAEKEREVEAAALDEWGGNDLERNLGPARDGGPTPSARV